MAGTSSVRRDRPQYAHRVVELNPVKARVIGSLAEKQLTTPQQYPLTLNALVQACNQSSNRDPVVAYDETTVELALSSLKEAGLLRFDPLAKGPRPPDTAKWSTNVSVWTQRASRSWPSSYSEARRQSASCEPAGTHGRLRQPRATRGGAGALR